MQNSVIWASGNSLTLSAHGDINISSGVKIANGTEGNPGTGNLYLRADSDGDGSGTVNFGTYPYPFPGHVDYTNSTGTVSIFYNPPGETNKYLNAIPFGSNGNVLLNPNRPSQLAAYMLVNNPGDLNAVRTNMAGTYALGKTIVFNPNEDAPFAPIANFTGVFDGQGQTIANLTIKPNNSTTHNIGLFGIIGAGAVVRDVNLVNVSVTANPGVASQTVGTLAGINLGTVSGVIATGTVDGGTVTDAALGGLVGANGGFNFGGQGGQIIGSHASVDVSSASTNVSLGGLVGFNAPGSIIFGSSASGDVIATAGVKEGGEGCSFSNSCQHVSAGGLVGDNLGTIASLSPTAPTFATGNVSVGSNGTAGGLVGFNSGVIANAVAIGSVTGAAGTGGINGEGGSTTLGGLVGVNQGLISGSSASGNVGSLNVGSLQAGGLVGDNSGTIQSSVASGNVQSGEGSNAGGLVASNSAFACNGCTNGDGSPFFNTAAIFDSHAFGDVTVGATSVAGGFAGAGDGLIANSTAIGNVLGGGNSVLGGFIGALSFENGAGVILSSGAAGSVTSTGSNSIVGGFAGLTGGTIVASVSAGPVSGTSDSYLGGFAGVNLGTIAASFTTPGADVTGTGSRDIAGGFVGANFGSIDSSASAGNAAGGALSTVGGFAGTNARFINFAPGSIPALELSVRQHHQFVRLRQRHRRPG